MEALVWPARSLPPVAIIAILIGLVGISMGGFLAAVAAQPELRIACVVELFGGLPHEIGTGLRRMPPTLIIHGDRDRVVPVGEAHALRDLLRARKLPCEVEIYKGVGHAFVTGKGKVCLWTALAAECRTTAFLARHLRKPATAQKGVAARTGPRCTRPAFPASESRP
jgi:carboxymethylenebutenolidase